MSPENASEDDQYQALAFYIVADVSYSMQESGGISAANDLLTEVHDAITAEPVIAESSGSGSSTSLTKPRCCCASMTCAT